MSSSSCYDDSPTEPSEKGSSIYDPLNKTDGDHETVIITQTKVVARRYEEWHEKFLSYKEVMNYLMKLGSMYKHKMAIEHLGYSREKRPICLVKITSGTPLRSPSSISVMIEAGSNGKEKMTVSSALFLIEYLVKNDLKLVVQYLIIPCLNPDAYEKCLHSKKMPRNVKSVLIDSSKSFPKNSRESGINLFSFFNKSFEPPSNCKYLMDAVEKYKANIKLFISLQASENSIRYPSENFFNEVLHFGLACKMSMDWQKLSVKPLTHKLSARNVTSAEFVISNHGEFVKFAYILNIHNKSFRPNEEYILSKGEQSLNGILTLTKRVYRYLTRQKIVYDVKTNVKTLGKD